MDPDTARKLLLAERERLERLYEEEKAALREAITDPAWLSEVEQHAAVDEINSTFEREMDQTVVEDVEGELALVDAALKRVDQGTYGLCEVDRKPIPDERLRERPMARFCLEHQRIVEKQAHAVRHEGADPTI
jgi:RNA polymerase-binding transcription factor DksA